MTDTRAILVIEVLVVFILFLYSTLQSIDTFCIFDRKVFSYESFRTSMSQCRHEMH